MAMNKKDFDSLDLGMKKSLVEKGIEVKDDAGNLVEVRFEGINEGISMKQLEASIDGALARAMASESKKAQEAASQREEVKAEMKSFVAFTKGYMNHITGKAPSAFVTETGTSADGSILLPQLVTDQIKAATFASPIMQRVTKIPVTFDTIRILYRDYSANQVNAYSTQGSLIPDSKLSWQGKTITLETYAALCPVTREAIEDLPMTMTQVEQKLVSDMARTAENHVINGGDSFEGIKSSPGTIALARDTTNRVQRVDMAKMYSRLWQYGGVNQASVAWSINPTVIPEIESFRDTLGLYIQGVPEAFFTLYGIPVLKSPFCSTLGTKADVILADWSSYYVGVKAQEMQAEWSPHYYFAYNLDTFRLISRMAGAMAARGPITENGVNYGFAVVLDSTTGDTNTEVQE